MRALANLLTVPALIAASALGCTDFDSPSELGDIQILAVRATPKSIPAGARAELEFLVAGPDGLMNAPNPVWLITDALGTEIIGRVVFDAGAYYYEAPAQVAEPTGVTLTLLVEVDGVQLNAVKAIGVGTEVFANPTVTELIVDGQTIAVDGEEVVVGSEDFVVSATVEPDPGEMGQLAWYSTFGVADPIRGPTVTIEVDSDRATQRGPLVVVARDGAGGVSWRTATLTRE